MLVVQEGYVDAVFVFIEYGVFIEQVFFDGRIVLYFLVIEGYEVCV